MASALLQTVLLLLSGQVLLGAAGYAANAAGLPWLGLPLLLLLFWLLLRTSSVLRREMEEAQRRKQAVVPWKLALFITLLWQAPAVLAVAPWSWVPDWAPGVWHGSLLPFKQTLELWFPAMATPESYWLLAATVVEAALFAGLTGRTVQRPVVPQPVAQQARAAVAAGEWAPARRLADARGRKNGGSKRVK